MRKFEILHFVAAIYAFFGWLTVIAAIFGGLYAMGVLMDPNNHLPNGQPIPPVFGWIAFLAMLAVIWGGLFTVAQAQFFQVIMGIEINTRQMEPPKPQVEAVRSKPVPPEPEPVCTIVGNRVA